MTFVEQDSTAPSARLWSALAAVALWPNHLETYNSVQQVDGPVPTDVGSRFAVRQPGLAPATYEVTVWEPGRAFTWEAHTPGVRVTASHTVVAVADGSRLVLGLEMSGPLAWLVRPLLASKTRRMVEAEARGLIRVAESRG